MAAVVALAVPILSGAAGAEEPYQPGWREVWTGADATGHVWLVYSGATVAPQANIYEDGLRLRVAGGTGGYTYTGERRGELIAFTAKTAFAEALVGYLKRFGPLTAKAFVGIAAIEHDISPLDPENPVQGRAFGPKLVTELWLNMGPSAWSSLDLSWTSAHQTAAARSRTGYRIFGDVSLGIEGGLNANDLGEDARAGLFARYAWNGGEFSLASGFSGRFLDEAESLQDPYVTANLLTQF
ncbi:MAG: cellulose biosynthesis protein BcsS [Hyphomicrobium sp.]